MCRAAGYYGHALAVAQAAHEPEWALDILLEDCAQHDEALDFLRTLPRQQAAAALTRHGKVCMWSRSLAELWGTWWVMYQHAPRQGGRPCAPGALANSREGSDKPYGDTDVHTLTRSWSLESSWGSRE